MAASSIQGSGLPLYLHIVSRILRELRILQQKNDTPFDYGAFKSALEKARLTKSQSRPLQQRLETFESFMVLRQTKANGPATANRPRAKTQDMGQSSRTGNSWKPVVS